ncbi:MAG: hypothetical protein QXI39_09915 [Candidatus Bathyarchaeia archaeon]
MDSKDQFDVQGPYVYDGASRNLASRSGTHTIKVDQILSPATGQRYYCSSPQQSVSGTATITFTYVYQYRLSISIIGGLPGAQITDPPPGDYWYGSGSSVSVRAITCTEAVRFDHWELDGVNVGSQNPYTVTMNAPHNLVAVFVQT